MAVASESTQTQVKEQKKCTIRNEMDLHTEFNTNIIMTFCHYTVVTLVRKAIRSYTTFKNNLGTTTVKRRFLVSQGRNLSRCLQFQVLHQGPVNSYNRDAHTFKLGGSIDHSRVGLRPVLKILQ